MTPEQFFLLDAKLRPIWRFFLSLGLVYLTFGVAHPLAQEVSGHIAPGDARSQFLFMFLFELLALLGSFKVMTRIFEHKPLGVVGLAFHPCWVRELCLGLGMGGIMMASVAGAEALLRLARFSRSTIPAKAELSYGGWVLLVLAMAATSEELLFRGYPFQKLVESTGPVGAVAVSSAFFGLAHLGNPHHTWISTANTMLVGIPLSIAYLRTRSLWMPMGMHFSWNYAQGFVFGLPLSGITFSTSLLNARVSGAPWLTGSSYGPEGGLLSTVAIVGAGIYFLLSPRIRMSERMRQLVFGPAPDTATNVAIHIAPEPGPGKDGPT